MPTLQYTVYLELFAAIRATRGGNGYDESHSPLIMAARGPSLCEREASPQKMLGESAMYHPMSRVLTKGGQFF